MELEPNWQAIRGKANWDAEARHCRGAINLSGTGVDVQVFLQSAVDLCVGLRGIYGPGCYGRGGSQDDVKTQVVKVVYPELSNFGRDCRTRWLRRSQSTQVSK